MHQHGSTHSFFGAWAPKVPSVPGTSSSSRLLSTGGLYFLAWGSGEVSWERERPGSPVLQALRDGARCSDWSYLERNPLKTEYFRERKRAVRPAGRECCRAWVPGEIALWDIGDMGSWPSWRRPELCRRRQLWWQLHPPVLKCLWACRRSVRCNGVCVCECTLSVCICRQVCALSQDSGHTTWKGHVRVKHY